MSVVKEKSRIKGNDLRTGFNTNNDLKSRRKLSIKSKLRAALLKRKYE